MGDRPDARPLPIQDNTAQKNADTHPCLTGFEPTIPVFERSKTVRASDLRIFYKHIKFFVSSVFSVLPFTVWLLDDHDRLSVVQKWRLSSAVFLYDNRLMHTMTTMQRYGGI
jgi:hypothetical protein